MNLDRLQTLINVMQRVRDNNYAFDIKNWQGRQDAGCIETNEEDLHRCGMPACVGGWLAVSPEFKATGVGFSTGFGAPVFNGRIGPGAIATYLECDPSIASAICATQSPQESYWFYRVNDLKDVTPSRVVTALERLYAEYAPHSPYNASAPKPPRSTLMSTVKVTGTRVTQFSGGEPNSISATVSFDEEAGEWFVDISEDACIGNTISITKEAWDTLKNEIDILFVSIDLE